jgi:hypothetical protein
LCVSTDVDAEGRPLFGKKKLRHNLLSDVLWVTRSVKKVRVWENSRKRPTFINVQLARTHPSTPLFLHHSLPAPSNLATDPTLEFSEARPHPAFVLKAYRQKSSTDSRWSSTESRLQHLTLSTNSASDLLHQLWLTSSFDLQYNMTTIATR